MAEHRTIIVVFTAYRSKLTKNIDVVICSLKETETHASMPNTEIQQDSDTEADGSLLVQMVFVSFPIMVQFY